MGNGKYVDLRTGFDELAAPVNASKCFSASTVFPRAICTGTCLDKLGTIDYADQSISVAAQVPRRDGYVTTPDRYDADKAHLEAT